MNSKLLATFGLITLLGTTAQGQTIEDLRAKRIQKFGDAAAGIKTAAKDLTIEGKLSDVTAFLYPSTVQVPVSGRFAHDYDTTKNGDIKAQTTMTTLTPMIAVMYDGKCAMKAYESPDLYAQDLLELRKAAGRVISFTGTQEKGVACFTYKSWSWSKN